MQLRSTRKPKNDQLFDRRFLHATLKPKDRPKNKFFRSVTRARNARGSLTNRLAAAIVLGAYAQNTDHVFLSKTVASKILDVELSGSQWADTRKDLVKKGFMVMVAAPSSYGFGKGTAGLYRITHEGFLNQLLMRVS